MVDEVVFILLKFGFVCLIIITTLGLLGDIGVNIGKIVDSIQNISNRILGSEDKKEVMLSQMPYITIYSDTLKEIIVDEDTKICYLINKLGGVVMMKNPDGSPKLYKEDFNNSNTQNETEEIKTKEQM